MAPQWSRENIWFILILYHGRLLTNHIKNKVLLGNLRWRHCEDKIEDVLHVMRDCPLIKEFWRSFVFLRMHGVFYITNFKEWIRLNILQDCGGNKGSTWLKLWAINYLFLWRRRNMVLHNDTFKKLQRPYHEILKRVKDYQLTQSNNSFHQSGGFVQVVITWKVQVVDLFEHWSCQQMI